MTSPEPGEKVASSIVFRDTGRMFPREFSSLPLIVRFTDEFLTGVDLSGRSRFGVDLAVEEIFTNFVRYNAAGKGDIEIRMHLENRDLTIALTDFDTDRFDITSEAPKVDVNAPLEERTPGGLGLHFVKQVMDNVDYAWADRSATIRLFKNLG